MKYLYLFVLISGLFLFSCEKKEIPFSQSCIDSLPLQAFSVNAEKDTVIKGKNGASFYIPGNIFEDEQGVPVKGSVEIKLLEINTIEDFIRSGITTESNGELLISDGSYYINIFQKDKSLSLIKGKTIYARLPSEKKDPEMKFFTGEKTSDGNVNWTLDVNQKPLSEAVPSSLKKKTNLSKPIAISDPIMSISPAEKTKLIAEFNDLSMYLHDNIYNEETHYVKLGQWYIPEEEADRLTNSKYGVSYSDYQPFNRYKKGEEIAKPELWEEETVKIPFKYRASIVEARDKRYKELCKILGVGAPEKPVFEAKSSEKTNRPKREANESWEDFLRRSDEAYKKQFGTQAYIYALNNLGWFNIDKYNGKNLARYEGMITDKEGEPVLFRIEVHLVSRREKMHLKTISENGSYSFKFPKNKAFDIVFVAGTEGVTESFDGSIHSLKDIQLKQDL